MEHLVYLIPLFPLLSFAIIALLGKHLSKNITSYLAPGSILASFIVALLIFGSQIGHNEAVSVPLFSWIHVGDFNANFSFLVDSLSIIFTLVITGVGFLIHVYSTGYMHDEKDYNRYFSYLNLFVFFMLLLVLGDNLLLMFVGWEGVGLCSYLLIGFWFKNINYASAAKKAFVMNRIGDLGFLLGIILIFGVFGSVNYKEVFTLAGNVVIDGQLITWITVLLFIGAIGKSAQIPLYTWLPDAMAGPTPVSALIHAATMVTAGIYMIARCGVLFSMSAFTMQLIAIIGIATAFLAATIALFQNDIKKVLAYSTVSQLGLIFCALGVGAFSAGVFHVVTHAFFKALLFLGAGSVIHGMSGDQDIRNMGGLKNKMPITYITFLIATIAISGIPPFAGFFSKDQMLAEIFVHNKILFALALIVSLMTAFYMFRLLFLTFFGEFRGNDIVKNHIHESPKSMTIPLMILAVLSVLGGFIGFPHELGHAIGIHHWLDGFLATAVKMQEVEISLNTELLLMAITIVLILIVIFIAKNSFLSKKIVPHSDEDAMPLWKEIIYYKYYIDEIYEAVIVRPLTRLAGMLYQFVERSGIDAIVNGIGTSVVNWSQLLRLTQTGGLGFYVITMVISMVVLFILMFIKL
ncbi:MAG TPA: NADH-quinone oxidoreductase subunit L [Chitinophagales bacterium]|nr:NADH-quinone oxidoreductase subunit L [Chitinophagales bacterium]HNA38987.1 NADH-quinone oxidoreductase subunit L [Chitinophagales bacterium]HNB48225.1 NADH-quinone oxidoreductase subunit L [Chitinophagales bacterium]HRG36565.1 NADH-quinone oxidoreductase subunit L [Chitinophagales bacterium]